MANVSLCLNVAPPTSTQEATDSVALSPVCLDGQTLSRSTTSSGRTALTEPGEDESAQKGFRGRCPAASPSAGCGPVTNGPTMQAPPLPRQQGEDSGQEPAAGVTALIDSFRGKPGEAQAVSRGFTADYQYTSDRVAVIDVAGPCPLQHNAATAAAAADLRGNVVSPADENAITQGPASLTWESRISHRIPHDCQAAARPEPPTRSSTRSGGARFEASTAGKRGTNANQLHKCCHEDLMRRVAAVAVMTLLLVSPAAGHYDRGGPQHRITWGRGNTASSAMFGDTPNNVTAVLGHRARLPCQVKNLGLKDVSWIRQRDLHILTVGIFTYTSDDRFKVFHPPETEDWYLDISSVTYRDAGIYECQVSTSPKVSLPVYLTVLGVQEADIPGPREVFIQHGSTISLLCEVRAGVEAVGPVQWLKGSTPLNYSSPRGGISMEVEKTPTQTTSKLYITRAVRADSGNYTCAPHFARPDSVIVHVVNAGEESAAAVHSGASTVVLTEELLLWGAIALGVARMVTVSTRPGLR